MKRIPLTHGKYALVDDADYERVNQYIWHVTPTGYARSALAGSMHRFILDAPDNMEVDHINRDGLDNQRSNLRLATRAQNAINRPPVPKTSKYKGVGFYKPYGVWRARLRVNYTPLHLGYFENEREAARAYDDAAHKHFGEFAYLNFPEHFE